jgi:hypothetical protein
MKSAILFNQDNTLLRRRITTKHIALTPQKRRITTKPIAKKPIRNIYGDPLPVGKTLKYNAREVYETITNQLTFNLEGKCTNAFKILSDPQTLKMAYESIKSKHGNMVRGTDKETLDGISAG